MLRRLFLDHPHSVNESYFEHMAFAGWFAGKLLYAGFAALVHAILPFCFERTASRIIRELFETIDTRAKSPSCQHEDMRRAA